jgi:hypothetical protein
MIRIVIAAALAFAAVLPAPAHAAARDRVFVASYGSDTNPCTFGSPCKTFQVAINAVAAGGEVTAIDSAGFGPITINKSVTVTSPDGVEAGIATPAGQNAITITAGPSDNVVLHGLTIDGANVATDGIVFGSGNSLIVSNCVVRNFTYAGIVINVAPGNTELTDSTIENNAMYGVLDAPLGANSWFNFSNTHFYGNSTALSLDDSNAPFTEVTATGSDSIAAGNGVAYNLTTTGGEYVELSLINVRIHNNVTGIHLHHGGVFLSRSAIFNNNNGYTIDNVGGGITSYGNNEIDDNSNTGTLNYTTLQ